MNGPGYYSPLRYPGGKGKIASYIKVLLEQNCLLDGHYVEPYAGGASVAFDLLFNEYVTEIHINDIDRAIFSFWFSVLNDTDHLCEKIRTASLNIEEWQRQRSIYKNADEYSTLEVGFALFYLNRTNRSGIITGGVIGGLDQDGPWKICARFPKEDLIQRIRRISNYKNRINLYNDDAIGLIKKLTRILPRKSFIYLDPPYYGKGKKLYVNYYSHQDHVNIAETLSKIKDKYWLLSYDNVGVIRELYSKYRQHLYLLNYSATGPRTGIEVLIFSDLLDIPAIVNPPDKAEIKQYSKARV